MEVDSVSVLDGFVLFVLLVAASRGAYIGMIRESFSIAALGLSCIALRFGNTFAATWLTDFTGGEIGPGAAPFITGAVILVGTIGLVGFLGRFIKRGAQAVGLGWADRIGGSALGIAEGALIATLVVLGTRLVFGADHASIQGSRSLEAVELLQEYVVNEYSDKLDELPSVAAPFNR